MPANTLSTNYGSLPFAEAIDFFKNKLNIPTERWNDVWQSGHNSGFMVAGALKDDLLNDFRKAVDSAIAEGKSINWFKKEFNNIVAKHGWAHNGKASWRAKVIFDTNMRQSYNAGRYEQLQHFDYWEYQHGDSRYPRAMHLKWHGTTLPKDHNWWQTHFPQNGWGCKCKVRGRTAKQLERQGKKVKLPPKTELVEWTDKATGEVHKIPKGIDPGFDYTPKKTINKQKQKKVSIEKAVSFQPPRRIAPTAFSTVKGADVHGLNRVLLQINTPEINKVGKFVTTHNLQSVLIKTSEMKPRSVAAKKITEQVLTYLPPSARPYGSNSFTIRTRRGTKTNGWTSNEIDHVIVRLESNTNFNKADHRDLINAIKTATLNTGKAQYWSISKIVRLSKSGDHGGAITTWLHEMGHQLRFKAGNPMPPVNYKNVSITEYGSKNYDEWHAEHFVAWVLNRETLYQWNKEVALYFDALINKVI
ncbi:MAG: F protein [Aliivibrio sp.]|uniref:phage head morphogenesis protein n=1 Tax=Aliivibrio sp. TaxID=1872443 RepID=UPI001A43E705|nr:F protein [Aliivibrio sp.]